MYYFIIAFIIAFDQIVKWFVRTTMELGESIPVAGDFFRITYIQNTGGAFSILEGHMAILILLPAVFTVAILIYITKKRKTEHWTLLLSLSMICGGGIGNFIDRVMLGYVVDFFDVWIWAIFNIADIFVCCGCGLLLLHVIFIERWQGKGSARSR